MVAFSLVRLRRLHGPAVGPGVPWGFRGVAWPAPSSASVKEGLFLVFDTHDPLALLQFLGFGVAFKSQRARRMRGQKEHQRSTRTHTQS